MEPQQEQRQIAEMLQEFEMSIGKSFVLKGDGEIIKTSFTDMIVRINRDLQLIIGEIVEAPVIWCQLKTTPHKKTKKADTFLA